MNRTVMEIMKSVDKKCGDDVPISSKNAKGAPKFELVDPLNASKADEGDLVVLARDIQKAYNYVSVSSISKLRTIQQQMKLLTQQAKHVMMEAGFNNKLHSLPCNFHKRIGSVYHVYKRGLNDYYISMLSPEEWGESMPHEYTGSYYLEFDRSWKPANEKSRFAAHEIMAFSDMIND